MIREHTPCTSVLYTAGLPARLSSFLYQVTWGRGQPCTAQLMQHSQPGGSRWARSPTRKRGFWRRSGSRCLGVLTMKVSAMKTRERERGGSEGGDGWLRHSPRVTEAPPVPSCLSLPADVAPTADSLFPPFLKTLLGFFFFLNYKLTHIPGGQIRTYSKSKGERIEPRVISSPPDDHATF